MRLAARRGGAARGARSRSAQQLRGDIRRAAAQGSHRPLIAVAAVDRLLVPITAFGRSSLRDSSGRRSPSERRAGFADVDGDLRLERLEPVEMPLLAQPLHEVHRDALAVDFAVEIEDQHLEKRRAAADRRTRADARDAVEQRRTEAADPHREDAVDRRPPTLQADIRRRESEALTESEPADDLPRHAVVAAEHRFRRLEVARGERRADRRAAHALAVERDGLDDGHVETVPLACAAQVVERAPSAVAEAEVVTYDDVTRVETLDQQPFHELLRREPAEPTKTRAEELVDPRGSEQLEALAEARQPRRRIVRREHLRRRRLERAYERRPPGRAS